MLCRCRDRPMFGPDAVIRTLIALMVILIALPAAAQQIERPKSMAQYQWTTLETVQKGLASHQSQIEITVLRSDPSELLVAVKEVGSNMPAVERSTDPDWSRARNLDGKQVVVNPPLAFPLTVGKRRVIDYTDHHPRNRAHASEQFHEDYVVTGWRNVTVPAGTFRALKIEANGEWTADLAPGVAVAFRVQSDEQGSTLLMQSGRTTKQAVSGQLYKAFWYVPTNWKARTSAPEPPPRRRPPPLFQWAMPPGSGAPARRSASTLSPATMRWPSATSGTNCGGQYTSIREPKRMRPMRSPAARR